VNNSKPVFQLALRAIHELNPEQKDAVKRIFNAIDNAALGRTFEGNAVRLRFRDAYKVRTFVLYMNPISLLLKAND